MCRFTILVCLIVLICLTGAGFADIPKLINYQGMLTDEGGNPLNETVSMIFKIYNDSLSVSSGDKKWEETQTGVEVTNGLFNVMLGRVSPLNLDFSEDYWLDITVGTEHLPDRIRLASVGYAYRAMVADTAFATTPGAGSHWSVSDSVLYTTKKWGLARGDAGNVLYGDSVHTHVNLGVDCTTGTSGQNHKCCTVGGGSLNAASYYYATVGGGVDNTASGYSATVGGGIFNAASSGWAAVGGGANNTASGPNAIVGGGGSNTASGQHATVGGGYDNTADTNYATVGGGMDNTASGYSSTVPGGFFNSANGSYSFAAGGRAKANHTGTFVWADSSADADFASTGKNQFLIRAAGGVGIGTTDPIRDLHVAGSGFAEIQLEKTNVPINKWHLSLWQNGLLFVETDVDYRLALENGGNVGIGTTDPNYKLDVAGQAHATSFPTSSDVRLKKNVHQLTDVLEKLDRLRGVAFDWNERYESLGRSSGHREIGVIAQEVEDVFPELVTTWGEEQYMAVDYGRLTGVLIEAIKELKAENEKLKTRIEALERE